MKSDKPVAFIPTGMGVQNDGRFVAVETRHGTIFLSRRQAELLADALTIAAKELIY